MNPRVKLKRDQILRLLDGYPVQVATEVGLLRFEGVPMDQWTPMERQPDNPAIFSAHQRLGLPPPDESWTNGTYDCFVKHHVDVTHLSVKRLDRAPLRNWRHFQQIKNEVCGEEREALEIYPAESRVADNANQYHLWVLPEGASIPLGFESGMVVVDPDDVDTFNTNGDRSRQEPMQEGLTIGARMQAAQERWPEDTRTSFQRVLKGSTYRPEYHYDNEGHRIHDA